MFKAIKNGTQAATKRVRQGIDKGTSAVLAVALVVGTLVLGTVAHAEPTYTPETIEPVALFDFAAMGLAVLTIMGGALAAVGLYKISVGIGKKVIAWFGGRA